MKKKGGNMDKYVRTVLTIVAIGVIGLNIQIFNSSQYLTFTVPKNTRYLFLRANYF